ncbi:hypothetical protein JZ751_006506 [Albula glossodonta]|uniref:Uncharacterized protein n=1 Tax=Albula glossodonta TaxID=121402 RepID=A0A8T2NAE6_9TELE|nr:hypothetical protein JZ751_006506 [Albula glossodonta]
MGRYKFSIMLLLAVCERNTTIGTSCQGAMLPSITNVINLADSHDRAAFAMATHIKQEPRERENSETKEEVFQPRCFPTLPLPGLPVGVGGGIRACSSRLTPFNPASAHSARLRPVSQTQQVIRSLTDVEIDIELAPGDQTSISKTKEQADRDAGNQLHMLTNRHDKFLDSLREVKVSGSLPRPCPMLRGRPPLHSPRADPERPSAAAP